MQTLVLVCAVFSLLLSARAKVLHKFKDDPECLGFFYKGTVPTLVASHANVAHICQRLDNRYHFATLYDKTHRIAVYSAYIFMNPNDEGASAKCEEWCIEPQLVKKDYENEMMGWKDFPKNVYAGESQALYEDYKDSGYDRGHLNPNLHNTGKSKDATYTLTNVVPQTPNLNQRVWEPYETELKKNLTKCDRAFVLVGAIPSENNWIVKNNVKRVNIPKSVWNAYCCVDNNGNPTLRGGAIARYDSEKLEEYGDLKKMKRDLKLDPDLVLFHNDCQKKKKMTGKE